MSAALLTPEVKAVLGDLALWRSRGIRIALVQATDDGVSVGVEADPAAAEVALNDRYPFRVTCWLFD
jgi:hypothetical protein